MGRHSNNGKVTKPATNPMADKASFARQKYTGEIREDPDWYSQAFVVGQKMTITFHPNQWEAVQQKWAEKGKTLRIIKKGKVPKILKTV